MQEFLHTVKQQMRMVSGVETINHLLNMLLIIGSGGVALWLWSKGQVGVGAVAAITAMSLRLNGISHWVMWEMTSLYEQIGTVHDGINSENRVEILSGLTDADRIVVRPPAGLQEGRRVRETAAGAAVKAG